MKPLTLDEISLLGELLASVPEPAVPMEADELDGYLAAIALMENPPAVDDWLPLVFDRRGGSGAGLPSKREQARLEDLVLRRGGELEAAILSGKPVDPVIYDAEDEDGNILEGKAGIAALAPFSAGFEEALSLYPELAENENGEVRAALVGILRYAGDGPGDDDEVLREVEREVPFLDIDEALADLEACIGEIAQVTRAGDMAKAKKPRRRH